MLPTPKEGFPGAHSPPLHAFYATANTHVDITELYYFWNSRNTLHKIEISRMVDIWETVEQHFLFLSVDKYRFSNMGNHYERRKDKQKKKNQI